MGIKYKDSPNLVLSFLLNQCIGSKKSNSGGLQIPSHSGGRTREMHYPELSEEVSYVAKTRDGP